MKRSDLKHFIDIKMDTTYSSCDYHLLGEGISSLTEEFNPEEETQQWINQENGTTEIKSYTPSISVEMQDVDQDDTDLVDWFNKMVDTLPTAKKAVSSYVRLRVSGSGPSYPAIRRACSISVGSTGGDAGTNVTNAITIGGRGDGVPGTFNITTMEFTPDAGTEPAAFSSRSKTTETTNKSSLS